MRLIAIAAAALALATAAQAANQVPQIPATNGNVYAAPSAIVVAPAGSSGIGCVVGATGCSLPVTLSGGGGGGGAVTAAAGSYAAGAIVDLGTGASPGANTTNGILKALVTAVGTPAQAGGATVLYNSAGTLALGTRSPTSSGFAGSTALNVNAFGALFNGTNFDLQPGTAAGGTFVQGPAAVAAAAVGNPIRNGGVSSSGAVRDLCVDVSGTFCSPKTGTANRVVTKTNLSANTSTTVCPTATNPVSTELYFTTAGVGISLAGGTLTTATIGTTASTTPDLSFVTANQLYTFPVAPTNAITAYGAAGIVVCIQNNQQ